MTITGNPPSDRIVATPPASDVVLRRVTAAHEPARQTMGIPPPGSVWDTQDVPGDGCTILEGETLEDV